MTDAPQMTEVLDGIRVPRPDGAVRVPGWNACVRTGPMAHAATVATCAAGRSSTPFPSRRTSGPTAGPRQRGWLALWVDQRTYRRRNVVERTILALKGFRAVAARYEKRAYVFHGTLTVAAIRLWLRP
ncbi:hypothetical protein FCH28_08620 [Streptomyces piniterrae]|uniref:Uncharacterized protein n=1 Tax=Streptomyces piniterrae TaxID=2571125 RepID=A0A4U0NSL4_9ACTN|nr:hypothetical protein FCH28_08620 [Streptomyces piniterrae]